MTGLATWEDVSRECNGAARQLLLGGKWRSSTNRSYYAAYCAVTARLVEAGAAFSHGWNNPRHANLPALIEAKLGYLSLDVRRQLKRKIRILEYMRVSADYRPGHSVNKDTATNAARDAYYVLRILGVIQ